MCQPGRIGRALDINQNPAAVISMPMLYESWDKQSRCVFVNMIRLRSFRKQRLSADAPSQQRCPMCIECKRKHASQRSPLSPELTSTPKHAPLEPFPHARPPGAGLHSIEPWTQASFAGCSARFPSPRDCRHFQEC